MESTSGWSLSAGSSVSSQVWPNLIASGHASSLRFIMPLGATAYKLYGSSAGVDVSAYDWIGFNQVFNLAPVDYQGTTDFALKMEVTWNTGAKEYYVPLTEKFDRCIFRTEGATTILGIKFTALKAVKFFVSDFISFTSNYPYDIFVGMKQAIDAEMDLIYPIVSGQITAAAGDESVTIDPHNSLERYSRIKFGSEIHRIDKFDQEGGATFFTTEDGSAVVSNQSNVDVELQIPVSINPEDISVTCPGISVVGGFDPELFPDNQLNADDWDTWNVDGSRFDGFKGAVNDYPVFVVGISYVHDNLEIIKDITRRAFAKGYIWVNGLRVEWMEDEAPSYQDRDEGGQDIIPKVTWSFRFRIEEEMSRYDKIVSVGIDVTATVEYMQ